jgi:hypothetical protein
MLETRTAWTGVASLREDQRFQLRRNYESLLQEASDQS